MIGNNVNNCEWMNLLTTTGGLVSLSFFLDKPSRHRRLGTPQMADNGIRRFFYKSFPNTSGVVREQNKKLAQVHTVLPESSRDQPVPYGELGMAIDYRIRCYFGITPYRRLVAFGGAYRHMQTLDKRYSISSALIRWFFEDLERFLRQVDPCRRNLGTVQERQLNRYCFVLALFEQLFRINPHPNNLLFSQKNISTVTDLLSIADDLWIEDLCSLSNRFYERYREHLSDPVHLNPTFTGSGAIGGADADLILNGCLLDIKTTVTPKITNTMLYQIVGYTLLDYEDEYHINELGIYLARQAKTLQWDIRELLDRLHTDTPAPPLAELRNQFKKAVQSTTRNLPTKTIDSQRVGRETGRAEVIQPDLGVERASSTP